MDDEQYELRMRDAYAAINGMVLTVELTGALLRGGVLTPDLARPVFARFDELAEAWKDFAPLAVGKATAAARAIREEFRI